MYFLNYWCLSFLYSSSPSVPFPPCMEILKLPSLKNNQPSPTKIISLSLILLHPIAPFFFYPFILCHFLNEWLCHLLSLSHYFALTSELITIWFSLPPLTESNSTMLNRFHWLRSSSSLNGGK